MTVGARTGRNSGGRHENLEEADLEKRTIKALGRYREAFASAEELEHREVAARREVVERLKVPIREGSPARSQLIQTGQAAIYRLNYVRLALSKATATLDLAYKTLAVLLDELGYFPVSATGVPRRRDSSPRRRKRPDD